MVNETQRQHRELLESVTRQLLEVVNEENENREESITSSAFRPGSLSPEWIENGEQAIEGWVSDRSAIGFDMAWKLLNRLLLEQQHQRQQYEQQQDHTATSNTTPKTDTNKKSQSESSESVVNTSPKHQNDLPKQPSKRDPHSSTPYFVRSFYLNQVIDCWRTCWRDNKLDITPNQMLAMMEQLEETYGTAISDNRTYTLIVDGIILRGDPLEAPLLAQWLFDRRYQAAKNHRHQDSSTPSVSPPDSVFTTNVIRAWAKSGRWEAPERAQQLFDTMKELQQSGFMDSGPTNVTYSVIIGAWAKSRHPDALQRMEWLLEDMKQSRHVSPDRVSYMMAISAWIHSKHSTVKDGPIHAYHLLQEMIQLYREGNNLQVRPDAAIFSHVMTGLARMGEAEKVNHLMTQLEELHEFSGRIFELEPTVECFQAQILANAKGGSCQKAQALLDDLVQEALANGSALPKRGYFVDLLVGWSKLENRLVGSEQAEKVLFQMIDVAQKSGDRSLLPDSKCIERVLSNWSKTNHDSSIRHVDSIITTLERMYQETGLVELRPTGRALEVALTAWSRFPHIREAPERAQDIVHQMERRAAAEGNVSMRPTRGAYTTLMLTWQRSSRDDAAEKTQAMLGEMERRYKEGESHLRPDVVMYSILIGAWAESGESDKAQAVMNRMVQANEAGNEEAKPDVVAFNNLLKAYTYSSDADKGKKAQAILAQFQKFNVLPNQLTFIEMVNIWSQSKSADGAERAEFYLRLLQKLGSEPPVGSYRVVIEAWSRSRSVLAAARSEALLEEFLAGFKAKKVPAVHFKQYQRFLQSIARSKIPRRDQQALRLLRELKQGQVHPDFLPPL